ncbi:MAG: ATP-binding protein [Chitinophagaceae bacterium]|nr:MAG: ATP-binding protein [Chitinophagaceae bacterium]
MKLHAELDAFAGFEQTALWQQSGSANKGDNEAFKTDRSCKELIEAILLKDHEIRAGWDKLRDSIHRFLGNFSDDNIFNFRLLPGGNAEFGLFAEQLSDFVANSKIEEYEKRVNERFSSIIRTLGTEIKRLLEFHNKIQKVIHNINKDFASKNFVSAIQKIELRIDDSVNTVVQLLVEVKEYSDVHNYDLGGMNLFSTVDQDAVNRKAIELLQQLHKAIGEYRNAIITLSDTFELKFRIEENHNDSGWVERLSNVGSEGTDVLVKAMINIMLLNVFKEGASKRFKDFRLHCMMDEIGKLHPVNVKGILQFANDRNINLINGSPTETNALDYKHIYRLEKDFKRNTRIKRIITNHSVQ